MLNLLTTFEGFFSKSVGERMMAEMLLDVAGGGGVTVTSVIARSDSIVSFFLSSPTLLGEVPADGNTFGSLSYCLFCGV